MNLTAREFIEAARDLARQSRELMKPQIEKVTRSMERAGVPQHVVNLFATDMVVNRMEIVMDCYLTGVEEAIRRLHGDTEPEPWKADFDHEARVTELLEKYGLTTVKKVTP